MLYFAVASAKNECSLVFDCRLLLSLLEQCVVVHCTMNTLPLPIGKEGVFEYHWVLAPMPSPPHSIEKVLIGDL
jgi:hypothetical protein